MPNIKLQGSDGQVFEVDVEIAKCSETIKSMLDCLGIDEDEDEEEVVPLPNVNSAILKKVIQWATYHKDDSPPPDDDENKGKRSDDISSWDADFLKVDQSTLFELMLAANYLDIKGLLDVTCKTVANMIIGKTPKEIRKTFNITNDFTASEEEQVRKENDSVRKNKMSLSITIAAGGLEMLSLQVPAQADIRDDVKMTCEYTLGEKSLYSVKWYKDEHEFFRYMPNHNPASQSFPAPGITLKIDPTPKTSVTLTHLSFNTSGSYRCEVSTEGPDFKTVAANQNMSVLALPKEDPAIEGILSAYSLGEHVTGNCTSAPSHPGSQLTWYINGKPAENYILEFYPPIEEDLGSFKLITNRLGIRFQVTRQKFIEGNVQLECVAFVGGRTWRRQVAPSLAKLTNQRLAQPQNTAACRASAPYWLLYSVALVIVYISDHLYFKTQTTIST